MKDLVVAFVFGYGLVMLCHHTFKLGYKFGVGIRESPKSRWRTGLRIHYNDARDTWVVMDKKEELDTGNLPDLLFRYPNAIVSNGTTARWITDESNTETETTSTEVQP